MTAVDLDDLESKARAATPGPWNTGSGEHWSRDVRCRDPGLTAGGQGVAWCGAEHGHEDAAYIAAAHPGVVLILIERVRAAEAEIARRNEIAWKADSLDAGD